MVTLTSLYQLSIVGMVVLLSLSCLAAFGELLIFNSLNERRSFTTHCINMLAGTTLLVASVIMLFYTLWCIAKILFRRSGSL